MKPPAKKKPARKATKKPRGSTAIDAGREDLVIALADGLSSREIAALIPETKSTVWRWSREPEIIERVAQERARRVEASSSAWLRHMSEVIDYAWKVAKGEAEVKSEHQMELLRGFLRLCGGAAALGPAAAPGSTPAQLEDGVQRALMPPGGLVQVNVYDSKPADNVVDVTPR